MNTRSPQTTGLECPSPGTAVFQRMLVDFSASQLMGNAWPSAIPEAFGPRNDGQFWAVATAVIESSSKRLMRPWLAFIFFNSGSGFRVQGFGFRVPSSEFRVSGFWFL